MRIPPIVMLAAAALAGCRPVEPRSSAARVDPAAVVVVRDTQVYQDGVAVVTATDTLPDGGRTAEPREHNDCRYVGTRRQPRQGEPGFGERYDEQAMEDGVPFRCVLRPGGPEVRLVVSGIQGIPMGVDVHSPPDAPRRMQQLLVDNDQGAYEGSRLLIGEDLNGDGWMDLRVFTYSGTGGQMSDVFRYVPSARRFVPDTALPGMNVRRLPGRPACVGISTKTSAWSHTGADYCWTGGTWVKVGAFAQEPAPGHRLIRTFQERRGGELRVVRVDTVGIEEPWPSSD
ncbi:MAG TPA: hypothetical protein VLK84_12965 [Longimicrobium sp.]|nr:hypothetical protein [Longimicrobium sp.]